MRALHPVAGIEAHIAPALMHLAEQQQRQLAPVAIAQQNGHMRFTPHVKHFGVRLDDPPLNFTHVRVGGPRCLDTVDLPSSTHGQMELNVKVANNRHKHETPPA